MHNFHYSMAGLLLQVTYPRYVVAVRPEKSEPYRTRITAGGDRIDYEGNVTTHTQLQWKLSRCIGTLLYQHLEQNTALLIYRTCTCAHYYQTQNTSDSNMT